MPRLVPETETLTEHTPVSEVEIDDTSVLLGLTGPRGERLKALERELSIECGLRGNTIYCAVPLRASRSQSGSSRRPRS